MVLMFNLLTVQLCVVVKKSLYIKGCVVSVKYLSRARLAIVTDFRDDSFNHQIDVAQICFRQITSSTVETVKFRIDDERTS